MIDELAFNKAQLCELLIELLFKVDTMAGGPESVVEMENLSVTLVSSSAQRGSRVESDDGRAENTREQSFRRQRESRDTLGRPKLVPTWMSTDPPRDRDSKPHISLCQVRACMNVAYGKYKRG